MIHFNHNGKYTHINNDKYAKIRTILSEYNQDMQSIDDNISQALESVLRAYLDNSSKNIDIITKTLKFLRKNKKNLKVKTITLLGFLGFRVIDVEEFIEDWKIYEKYYNNVLF